MINNRELLLINCVELIKGDRLTDKWASLIERDVDSRERERFQLHVELGLDEEESESLSCFSSRGFN